MRTDTQPQPPTILQETERGGGGWTTTLPTCTTRCHTGLPVCNAQGHPDAAAAAAGPERLSRPPGATPVNTTASASATSTKKTSATLPQGPWTGSPNNLLLLLILLARSANALQPYDDARCQPGGNKTRPLPGHVHHIHTRSCCNLNCDLNCAALASCHADCQEAGSASNRPIKALP